MGLPAHQTTSSISMLLYKIASTETIRTITILGTRGPGQPPRPSHSLSWALIAEKVQCCFMSTETIRTITSIRDLEPRMVTSTFTQPLSCPSNNTITWSFYGIPKLVPASHQVAQSLRLLMGSFVHQVWPVIQSKAEKKGLIMGSKT